MYVAANNNNNMPCNVKSIKEKKSHNAIVRDLSIWLISAVVQNQKSMAQLFACHKHNFTIRLKFKKKTVYLFVLYWKSLVRSIWLLSARGGKLREKVVLIYCKFC